MIPRRRQVLSLIVVAAAAFSSVAGAQDSPIDKGAKIIGGSAAINRSHDSDSDVSSTSFTLSPRVLFFLQQRLAFGATVALSYLSLENGHSSSYGIGPEVRYYFGDPAGKTFSHLSAAVFPSWQNAHSDIANPGGSENDIDSRLLNIDAAFGVTHFIATHVGISGEAFYTYSRISADFGPITNKSSGYNIGARFGIVAFLY